MTSRSDIPSTGLAGVGIDPASLPGAIDEANLDRIARSLMLAIPGGVAPEVAIAAATAIPGVPQSYGVPGLPSLIPDRPTRYVSQPR